MFLSRRRGGSKDGAAASHAIAGSIFCFSPQHDCFAQQFRQGSVVLSDHASYLNIEVQERRRTLEQKVSLCLSGFLRLHGKVFCFFSRVVFPRPGTGPRNPARHHKNDLRGSDWPCWFLSFWR